MKPERYWNYRVVKRTVPAHLEGQEDYTYYAIYEAHYDHDELYATTTEEIAAHGESLEELREVFTLMLKALDKPVVDYETRKEIEVGQPKGKVQD